MTTNKTKIVKRHNNNIGIELNIDTSASISKILFDEVLELLFKYKVVVIKKQQLTNEELLRFALKFGSIFNSNKAQVLGF